MFSSRTATQCATYQGGDRLPNSSRNVCVWEKGSWADTCVCQARSEHTDPLPSPSSSPSLPHTHTHPPTHHHHATPHTPLAFWVTLFVGNQAGDLPMASRSYPLVSSGGSAVRRRERRLRSFWRHERMAIQMALATVTHHSFQVGTAHDAPRSQKLVTSAGEAAVCTGTAARRGASWGPCPHGADPRCSGAADGGRRSGFLWPNGLARRRAGYQSAIDLLVVVSFAGGSPRSADGGTVG